MPSTLDELNTILGVPQRLLPSVQLRAALLDFFRQQDEDGGIRTHGDSISDAECHLTQALCRYVRSSGDSSVLAERVQGLRVIDRVFAAMEHLWSERLDARSGLILNQRAADRPSVGVHINAFACIAVKDMLELPGGNPELRRLWTSRVVNLGIAIRTHLWDAAAKRYTPRRITPEGVVGREADCLHPLATSLAIRAGFLKEDEKARSLAELLQTLRREGGRTAGYSHRPPGPDTPDDLIAPTARAWEWVAPAAQIAAVYAASGFPGHAMELLRPIAEFSRDHSIFPEAFDANGPRDLTPSAISAASYLQAYATLAPLEGPLLRRNAPSPPPAARLPRGAFLQTQMTAPRALSFKRIEFDEKRARNRVNVELPVELTIRGWIKNRMELSCVLRNPSLTGLGLQMSAAIPEGTIVELKTFLDDGSTDRECSLRGRLVWSKSKVGTRLYHAGVELDRRSKHLKRWQKYIQKHIDAKTA